MASHSAYRGHPIHFDESKDAWLYDDDNTTVKDHWKERPCGRCGKATVNDGHDACIVNLPGVMNACCGHGDKEAYVQFIDDRESVYGEEAIRIQKELKNNK